MKILVTIKDAPYGSERTDSALRLAGSLAKRDGVEIQVFHVGDGAACAKSGQKVPQGYDNVQVMLSAVTRRGGRISVCGTCMEASGITEAELAEGTHKSSLGERTTWTVEADKALVF